MLRNDQVDYLVRNDLGGRRYYPRIIPLAAREQGGGVVLYIPPSPNGQICPGATVTIRRSDAIALARQLTEAAE